MKTLAPRKTKTDTSRRQRRHPAKLIVRRKLSLPGSEKETYHYELAIEGLNYEPGDSLAVFPTNPPRFVERILRLLEFSGDEVVEGPTGEETTIRAALLRDSALNKLSKKFLRACAERVGSARFLDERYRNSRRTSLEDFLWGRDLVDFFTSFPEATSEFTPADLVALLPGLQPRLYSIASSQAFAGDCAHLLVTNVSSELRGRVRKGVCSSFLSERADESTPIPVFVHSARHFHLPDDPDVPLIMIGAGCGVAPFRGFLQERMASGARGKTWLFFGEQRERTDFYYREEWELMLASGSLSRMNTAFSRDQPRKIYIQQRIRENASDLWSWIEKGACIYVCGNANHMAPEVETALEWVVRHAGRLGEGQASSYLAKLHREKRYRKDIY